MFASPVLGRKFLKNIGLKGRQIINLPGVPTYLGSFLSWRKLIRGCGLHLYSLIQDAVADCCEYGTEPSGSVKDRVSSLVERLSSSREWGCVLVMVTLANKLISCRQHLEEFTSQNGFFLVHHPLCNTYVRVFLNARGDVIVSSMAIVPRVCIHSSDTGYYDANSNNLPRCRPQ